MSGDTSLPFDQNLVQQEAASESALSARQRATPRDELLLVSFLLLLFPALLLAIFGCWPTDHESPGSVNWFLLVTCAGALGAYVHVARSVGAYIGNNALVRSWIYWYLLRLPVGATLSLLIFLLMQGDVIPDGGTAASGHGALFRTVGISGLAGLFSDGTVKKLSDWFNMIFRAKDESLKDSLSDSAAAAPVLKRLEPPAISSKGGELSTIGENFRESSRVLINGRVRRPSAIRDTSLSISIAPAELEGLSSLSVQVMTPDAALASVWRLSEPLSLKIEGPVGGGQDGA